MVAVWTIRLPFDDWEFFFVHFNAITHGLTTMCSCFRGAAVPLPPVVDKEWILGSSDELIYIPYRYAREEEVWSFLIVSPMHSCFLGTILDLVRFWYDFRTKAEKNRTIGKKIVPKSYHGPKIVPKSYHG